jgi:hypothetical protein
MTQSAFIIAAMRCPPSAIGTRALMEVLDHFKPSQQCYESLRDVAGNFIGGSEARTAIAELTKILGPCHPAIAEASHALRGELQK